MAIAPEIVPDTDDQDELDSALEAIDTPDETTVDPETPDETTDETTDVDETVDTKDDTTDDADDTDTDDTVDDTAIDPSQQIREMRSLIRDQKREMALLKARQDRQVAEKPVYDEDGIEIEQPPVEPANIEKLSAALNELGQTRGGILDVLAETMSEGNYPDLHDVCSPENFSDIFAVIADGIAGEQGIPVEEAELIAQLNVWQMANPYKYMYGLIKEHHPDYVKPPETKAVAKPAETVKPAEVKPKTTEAPVSIAGVGAGDAVAAAGWTTAKIDALPEDELDSVPDNIYKLYMENRLK